MSEPGFSQDEQAPPLPPAEFDRRRQEQDALTMHLRGATAAEIARELGLPSGRRATVLVNRAIKAHARLTTRYATQARDRAVARLETHLARLERLQAEHPEDVAIFDRILRAQQELNRVLGVYTVDEKAAATFHIHLPGAEAWGGAAGPPVSVPALAPPAPDTIDGEAEEVA